VVRLAVAADVAPAVLGPLIERTTRCLSGVKLQVGEVEGDDSLLERLVQGSADLAIGAPMPESRLETRALFEDPFVLLVPVSAVSLVRDRIAHTADLTGHRLIMAASTGSDSRLRAVGLRLDGALRVPTASVVPALVARGAGVGLLPRSAVGDVGPGLAVLSTRGLIASRQVALCWHAARRQTSVLNAFSAAVVSAFADRSETLPERSTAA
jgi:LysR family hydrogen peroxide-inducible transcriptional activator